MSNNPPSPLGQKFRENIEFLLISLLIIITIAITSIAWDEIKEAWTKFWNDPSVAIPFGLIILSAIVLSIIYSILIGAYFLYRKLPEEERLARRTVDELRHDFDPTQPKSPLNSFYRQATEFLQKFEKNAESHNKFSEWANPWQQTAKDVLEALKAEHFKNQGLLLEPADYTHYLQKANEKHKEKKKQDAATVRLCGSMVGFSFLLPGSLRRHASAAKRTFRGIKLLAADVSRDEKDTFWFSVFLVAQTVRGMWDDQCCVKDEVERGHRITVETRYVDHDLFAAMLEVPGASLAVLQSLDVANFRRILESVGQTGAEQKHYQLGFSYEDEPAENDEYSRYSRALDDVWQRYEKRSEIWILGRFDDSSFLKMWSPRWTYDGRQVSSLKPKPASSFEEDSEKTFIRYGANRKTNYEIANFLGDPTGAEKSYTKEEIRPFLDELVEEIPNQNNDILMIDRVFKANPSLEKLRAGPIEKAAP